MLWEQNKLFDIHIIGDIPKTIKILSVILVGLTIGMVLSISGVGGITGDMSEKIQLALVFPMICVLTVLILLSINDKDMYVWEEQ